jgi:hypothetical protein
MFVKLSKKAERLAKKLGVDDPFDLWSIECGLHSGYPACCVAFHVLIWQSLTQGEDSETEDCYLGLSETVDRYLGLIDAAGGTRIQCPACLLKKRVVQVKKCDCLNTLRALESLVDLHERSVNEMVSRQTASDSCGRTAADDPGRSDRLCGGGDTISTAP